MLLYTLWDTVELIFVWFFYVETKGPTLEEIARIFDGNDAVAHIDLYQVEKEIQAANGWDEHAGYATPMTPVYERPVRVASPSTMSHKSHERNFSSPTRPDFNRNFSIPQAYPRDPDTPRFERNPITGRYERVMRD